jgi:nicotinate-nucleotide adenylyltransferase
MPLKHIAVLGAAFDPPTLGHQDVILQCQEDFSEVWLVPAFHHAFEKQMSPYQTRLEMLRVFVKDLNLPHLHIKACEDKIQSDGPVYSINLMQYLQKNTAKKDDALSLIIGPDNAAVFDRFKDAQLLKQYFSPHIVKERRHIRSTKVRDEVSQGNPIETLVTPSVAEYIKAHKLYSSLS